MYISSVTNIRMFLIIAKKYPKMLRMDLAIKKKDKYVRTMKFNIKRFQRNK